MNTPKPSNAAGHLMAGNPIWRTIIASLVLGLPGGAVGADADPAEHYFQNVLTNPGKAVLLAEARGRVTIYDGLPHRVVEQALDEQFERIDHMMFIRTRYMLPDGSEDVDEDCD